MSTLSAKQNRSLDLIPLIRLNLETGLDQVTLNQLQHFVALKVGLLLVRFQIRLEPMFVCRKRIDDAPQGRGNRT